MEKRKISYQQFNDFLTFRSEPIKLSSVPTVFKDELFAFMFGKTVSKFEGEIAYHAADFNTWVSKVNAHGLEHAITLEL